MYDAHLNEIYAFVSHLLEADRKSCEDLNQEVWLQAISCIKAFDPARGERARLAVRHRKIASVLQHFSPLDEGLCVGERGVDRTG